MLSPLAHKSLTDVTRRKVRTVLVVLGIVTGVAGLTAINLAQGALGAAYAYSASKSASPDISVSVLAADPSLEADIAALPNVKVAQIFSIDRTRWNTSVAPGHVGMLLVAYPDPNHVRLSPYQLSSGRQPGKGEVVLESSDRQLQPFALGDHVTIATPNGPATLTVVGTSRTLGQVSAGFSSFAIAYMTQDAFGEATGISKPNAIYVQVKDKSKAITTGKAVTDLLAARGVTVLGADLAPNNFDPSLVSGLFTIMNALSVVALLLTSFLILNTITTLIGEQVRVIGAMKAIGATRADVMRGYFMTIGAYAVTGTVLGIGLGILLGYELLVFLATIITLDLGPFTVDPRVIALAAAVGLGIPLVAAFFPLFGGTRITVREAIGGHGVAGAATRRGSAGSRSSLVPQTVWLGLQGLFRKRTRAILTLLALTFSASSFLAIQTTSFSVDQFIGKLFSQYGSDMFVNVARPEPVDELKSTLMAVPNVARVERFDNNGVNTPSGLLILTGLEQDPVMYKRTVISGRWFMPGEDHVLLLSEQAAAKTHLKTGDSITLSNASKKESWKIIGVVHDLNGGLGTIGTGLTSIENIYSFQGLPPGYAASFMIGTADHAQSAVDQTANKIDEALVAKGLSPVVTTAKQNIDRNQNQFQILYVLLYAVAALVALVGVLGLFNTLTTSVLERRREIGILRSLGATGWRVATVFWTEGMALAGVSWAVALVVGIPAAYAFVGLVSSVLLPIDFAFSPVAVLLMLAFTVVMATAASVIPALGAARMRVADTLRYE